MLYALSGVPREAFSQFPMRRKTAVFGPTFDGEGVVRSDDITKDPRCRAVRDIVEAPLTLPDGRTLYLYAVHFPSGGNPNGLSAALPGEAMAAAGGDFNFPCNKQAAGRSVRAASVRGSMERAPRGQDRMRRARL